MRPQVVSGGYPIAVLSFLAKLKGSSILNRVPRSIAVRCFQSYLKGQAESLVPIRLTESAMTVDSKQSENNLDCFESTVIDIMLRPYGDVVIFLLQTYVTDEVIARAYNVVLYRQRSSVTDENYVRILWNKALRYRTGFSDRRLKSLFIDGLLQRTQAQTRQFPFFYTQSDHHTVARQVEALEDWVRVSRRPAKVVRAVGNSTKAKARRGAKKLSV